MRHDILERPVVVSGFPIPSRQYGEEGLETSLQNLMHLAGTEYMILYDENKLALCGFSTVLFPSEEHGNEGGDTWSFEWHAVSSRNAHTQLEISKWLVSKRSSWLLPKDPGALLDPGTKTFLGYCSVAHINLGTQDGNYTGFHDSNLPPDKLKPGIKVKSISTGVGAMGFWNASTSADVVYPKSLSMLATIDIYDDILEATRTICILLYDVQTKLGWLVPAQRVLLHLAQLWIKARNRDADVSLPFADPGWTKPEWWGNRPIDQAPEDILKTNRKLVLRTNLEDDKEFYLMDLIKQFWAQLNGCAVVRRTWKQETSDNTINAPASERLLGWELNDFVGKPTEFRARLETTGFLGCGWDELADDPDVWVLMGKGFGSIITPANADAVCESWKPIPSNRRYLAASLGCLVRKDLPLSGEVASAGPAAQNEAEAGLQTRVTEAIWWSPSPNLNDSLRRCMHPNSQCPRRLEKLISKLDSRSTSLIQLSPGGAVIFGTQKLEKVRVQHQEQPAQSAPDGVDDKAETRRSKGFLKGLFGGSKKKRAA